MSDSLKAFTNQVNQLFSQIKEVPTDEITVTTNFTICTRNEFVEITAALDLLCFVYYVDASVPGTWTVTVHCIGVPLAQTQET